MTEDLLKENGSEIVSKNCEIYLTITASLNNFSSTLNKQVPVEVCVRITEILCDNIMVQKCGYGGNSSQEALHQYSDCIGI